MSSTKPLFVQILHVWVIFWDFLERYLAGTFRTINESSSSLCILRLVFFFGDNTVVHFENCYAHFCYDKNSTSPFMSRKWKICVFWWAWLRKYNFRLESEGTKNNGFRIGRKGDLIRVDYLQSTQILNFNPFF